MSQKVVVLGAGLVGYAITRDLHASGYNVLAVDHSLKRLNMLGVDNIAVKRADVTNSDEFLGVIKDCDLVIGALPGSLGFQVMKNVIEAGKNIIDISFCPEDYMELDALAKQNNVTAITDIGVAPGMCNVLLGHHNSLMKVTSYKCIVGGLPLKREWPLEYQATWSPIDVIEEYVRPARYVENGAVVVRPAMSDAQLVEFENIGTLEEWNSDGLRSLIQTMPHIPHMIEKTLRYPGTIEYLRVLKALGFFSEEPVDVDGRKVKPLDVTAKLLFPKWKMKPEDREFTAMRVTITGTENGVDKTVVYNLLDKFDEQSKITSMARTTGYTCTGAANLVLKGIFNQKGVCPPEIVGGHQESFDYLIEHLEERNIFYKRTEGETEV